MRRNGIITALLAGILLLWNACSTDLDVNAEWKDYTIVYGILDQSEKTQYIKINKAFLGEGNALQMAKVPDSSYYDPNVMEVKLIEKISNGVNAPVATGRIFTFDTTMVKNKEEGTFYYPDQIVYSADIDTLYSTSGTDTYYYEIRIKNTTSGKEVSSITPILGKVSIEKPRWNPTNPMINFAYRPDNNNSVVVKSAKNARLYKVVYRFYYQEFLPGGDTTQKSADWFIGETVSDNIESTGDELSFPYETMDFYSFIKQAIPYDAQLVRIATGIELITTTASDEFNTYIELNEPSSSLVQDRPQYSNIENGLGLFACRFSQEIFFNLHPDTRESIIKETDRGFKEP